MDERLLDWLKDHKGQTSRSPREIAVGVETRPFRIVGIDEKEKKVKITFIDGSPGLGDSQRLPQ